MFSCSPSDGPGVVGGPSIIEGRARGGGAGGRCDSRGSREGRARARAAPNSHKSLKRSRAPVVRLGAESR